MAEVAVLMHRVFTHVGLELGDGVIRRQMDRVLLGKRCGCHHKHRRKANCFSPDIHRDASPDSAERHGA
jgi:hypothetical protein